MTLSTLYRSSIFIILISLTSTTYSGSGYFNNPYFQYASGTLSNLCQIGSMCGSGLAWFGKTGLAGSYYTTELIKNNPKIAGTLALYTAWYMGQKRWAEDTINKAEEFLASVNKSGFNPTFKTWSKNRYETIALIMADRLTVGENLIRDYDSFNTLSFCKCLKNRVSQQNPNTKALAIKLALEIEYLKTEEILNLFTKNRTIGLTNVPYWIEEWIANNYNINEHIDIFDLYNIFVEGNTKTSTRQLAEAKEEIKSAQDHIQIIKTRSQEKSNSKESEKESESSSREIEQKDEQVESWEKAITKRKNEIKDILKKQTPLYEEGLNQFISQKIASTGLPVTRFLSERPTAYWSWVQTAKWNIPSGFIWPYERKASELYWELFKYTQRLTALHSAISEYIKDNSLPDVGSSYSLGQSQQIIDAVTHFLGNSSECGAQYCIKKLEAPRSQ